jgi:2-keto-4-pentenoate hydratase/2-oxohepta-3-ene-1,7-dioic acid hydratase in catechol pathway
MRLANVKGRLTTFADGQLVDVERESQGRFGADPQAVYERWDDLVIWGRSIGAVGGSACGALSGLGPPVPAPRQLFAVGLNYRDHAEEVGMPLTARPTTFTKFQSCLTGPDSVVELASETTDWEVELVVVIARHAYRVPLAEAAGYVAGYTIGQDLSERTRQMEGAPPQFSLGKSYPGYGPTGPWVVTLDEFSDPDDLAITCDVAGSTRQKSRTSQMLFPAAAIVAELSAVCTLLPGDIIFTGTPAGVGFTRSPSRFLQPGETLESWIEGVGTIRTRFTAATGGRDAG